MKYLLLLFLLGFCLVASLHVPAVNTFADVNIVPSPNCLSKNPCVTSIPSTAAPSTTVPSGTTTVSGQPNSSPSSGQGGNPSPSSSAPCLSTSQSSVSSQNTGSVSALSRHHGKRHHPAGGGFLQQFIQFLWQLLKQLFQKFGIQLPNITPCSGSGSTQSPSGTPSSGGGTGNGNGGTSGNPSSAPSSAASGGGTGTSPAPSKQPGGTGSIGSPGRFGMALGSGWEGDSTTQLNSYFADMESIGTQWVRFDVQWSTVQPNSSSYNWAPYDNVVKAATQHNLKVLGILDAAPSWAQQSSCAGQYGCPPNGTSAFATFAAAAATHYAPMGVTAWEIYNEQNTGTFWSNPSALAYTALLKAAYTAIHQAVPSGETVVSGGLAPSGGGGYILPNTYVQQMYAAGAKGYFDALGDHPYCFSDPVTFCATNNSGSTDGWGMMAYGPNNILSIMKANGDSNKQIWMTEFGANGNYTPAEVSQMMQQAFNLTANQSWAGPIFWYTYLNGDGFGLINSPAYSTYKQLAGK